MIYANIHETVNIKRNNFKSVPPNTNNNFHDIE